MKILLDTHIFLWYISKDTHLPPALLRSIRDTENSIFLSVVSLWEVLIKNGLGKLPLPQPPAQYIPTQRQRHQILNLDLDEASVKQLVMLPRLHRDPFDRAMICQAIQHDMTLATVDQDILNYPVRTLPLKKEPSSNGKKESK